MWTNKYIGIPYKDAGDDETGLDCWGLVRLVYKNELNVELPSFKEVRISAYDTRGSIIDEYKQDGWVETTEPKMGTVVLVRVKGLPIHTGVMVDSTKFLNILPGANCVIADITNSKWRDRIIGFYNYTPNSHSIILTGTPHPLKTQVYTMPAMAGHTVAEINDIITNTYKVPQKLVDRMVMIVNGRPIPPSEWNTFILQPGDRVEYRARPGIEALIAEAIIWFETGAAFVGAAEAGMTAAAYVTSVLGYSSATLAIASAVGSILVSTAISYALAPARPKLPTTNDPGTAEAQLLATGNANQLSKYGTIPIVLGKIKVVPPLGAINYVSYFGADERDSYLSMLLTWGYGPLKLYNWKPNSVLKEPTGSSTPSYYKWDASTTGTQYSGLKLGNIILDNYTIDAITHKNIYDGDYVAGSTNQSKESATGFNTIYGQDFNQQFKNQPIINDIHPLNGTGSVANPLLTAVEATVPNLGNSITNPSEFYNRIEIALHFPEGLRKIRVKGDNDNIGRSYSLMEGATGAVDSSAGRLSMISALLPLLTTDSTKFPVILKFEYKLGAVTTPASSATGYLPLKVRDKFGNTTNDNGIIVLGDISYKDAFTRVYYADNTVFQTNGSNIFPFKGEISVRVTRLTGDRGEAPAEGTPEYNTWGSGGILSDGSYCRLAEETMGGDGVVTTYTAAPVYTNRGDCLAANASAPFGSQYEWIVDPAITIGAGSVALAKDWRILHKVNFLSFTASRSTSALINPKTRTASGTTEDIPLTHTALRIKSSEQLNGQLEGINGVVQTLGWEYTGTDPNVLDLTKWVDLTPISNPASLFLHVLLSPANPKRILLSEVTSKVDLIKIQKWWKYCDSRPEYTFSPDNRKVGGKFTYNQVIGQAKSVLDILKDICAAGRASPAQVDGKWTVNIDEEKSTIVQMFTTHNSWDFSSSRNLEKAPDALRISFYDEDNDYQETEIIVYNKGKTEASAVMFESVSLPGITKASLAEDHAKWHMAQAIVRRELYTLNTDLEYLICNRGDRVTVTHDVPMWGYGSGRIRSRKTFNASNHVLVVDLDEPVILDPSKSYGIKIRSSSFASQSVERGILTSGIAFQSISRATDGFTVTVNLGTNYVPFAVGDKIVINSSGDFSTTGSSPAIVLSVNDTTAPFSFTYIKAGTASATAGSGTISLTNGLYRRIQFDSLVGTYTGTKKDGTTPVTVNLAEEGDLFLFGEYQKISNDLLVLSIEPDTNKGARLTLVDYAYDSLFKLSTGFPAGISGPGTGIPAYLSQTADLIFRPNISSKNDLAGFTEDDSAPEIGDPVSDIDALEKLSSATYNYRIKLPYANKVGGTTATASGVTYNQITSSTPTDITHVECQYSFNTAGAAEKSIKVPWLDCTVYISDVQIGQSYKMRLRYVKRDGRVGKWSSYKYHTVTGPTKNYSVLDSVTAYLSGTDLVIVPNMPNKPNDFKWFEVRVWKDNAPLTYDFWDYSTTNLMTNSQSNDTKIFRILRSSDSQGLKTDLKTFGNAGSIITTTGVRYKIACRAWDGLNYSNVSSLTTWFGRTIGPGIHTIIPAVAALNLQVTPPYLDGRVRTDLWGMKIWISKPVTNLTTKVTTPADATFTASNTNLAATTEGLTGIVSNLEVDKTHYFRYALVSSIDPTVLTISDPYSFIPRNSTIAQTRESPPVPKGITATAGVASIIITLPSTTVPGVTQATDYGTLQNDYTGGSYLESLAGSMHRSTVVYGLPITSINQLPVPTFSSTINGKKISDSILGEFTEKTVFTLPADPGTAYALFFRYRNNAGNLSYDPSGPFIAQGPVLVETGINVQKFLDMLADQITEGQLFKGLQKQIGGNRIPQIDVTAGQYTVKIDNGGHVAGFGLTNTSRSIKYDTSGNAINQLSDGSPFSEFGVVADRFWISAPAVQSDTAPTTGLHHGKRWIDTGSAGNNAGVVFGVTVYYNTYKPNTHNTVIFESDSAYWYWEIKTKTQLEKLIVSGATYVNKGTWTVDTAYAVNDYVFDSSGNVYYVCIKAYTPAQVTNLATINPKKLGTFTGSGASFAVNKTLYIYGKERMPSGTSELAVAGESPSFKMNPDYNSSGTFYYITDVTGSEFTLSLEKGGNPIVTGIKPYVQYYNIPLIPNPDYNLDPTLGSVDKRTEIQGTPGWIPEPAKDMFPFTVVTNNSSGVRPGVYIRSAYIQDGTITNAKIADAAIDSAKIAYLEAGKIKGGTIDADVITAGAISINKVDIGSLRGKAVNSWNIASPTLNTSEISRMVDLPPGDYEIILTSTFGRQDEVLGSDTSLEEQGKIIAEITGVSGSSVEGIGYWKKTVDSTKLEIKIKDKTGTISTQPTISVTDGSISFSLTAPDPPPPPPSGDGGGDGY
jgi:sulfur carrier protein ThiS